MHRIYNIEQDFPGAVVVNSPSVNAGDIRDARLNRGLGRSCGGRHDHPFHYSCLRNPMDRGAW